MTRWAERTTEETEAQVARVLFLPVGSTEAHGPHLPLDTDVLIAEAMIDRAIARLEGQGISAARLPALAYGVTEYAAPFAGTISVSKETVVSMIRDIARGLGSSGAEALVLANGHLEQAHRRALREAVEPLVDLAPKVLFPDNTRRPWAERLGAEFLSGSCHAGRYETSILLAACPERVQRARAQALPDLEVDLAKAARDGAKNFLELGMADAYCGQPKDASAEEGEQILEVLATMLVETALQAIEAR
ncbi:MAG: creatininase family protein [Planctomycetota bacterium]